LESAKAGDKKPRRHGPTRQGSRVRANAHGTRLEQRQGKLVILEQALKDAKVTKSNSLSKLRPWVQRQRADRDSQADDHDDCTLFLENLLGAFMCVLAVLPQKVEQSRS